MDELSEHERRQLAESLDTVNRLLAPRTSAGGRAEVG